MGEWPAAPVPAIPAPRTPLPEERLPPTGRLPAQRRWPSLATLVRGTVGRNVPATLVGIVAGWFNVPLVVLLGAVGALFGGLAGALSGTVAGPGMLRRIDTMLTWVIPLPISARELLPTAAAQLGGIIGGILGALNGATTLAWIAAVWPWEALYANDPIWPWTLAVGQVVTALVVGALYVAYSMATERMWWRLAGARRPSRREAAWLLPILAEVTGRLGLRSMPQLLVRDHPTPNAAAGHRYVVVHTGLLDHVSYDRRQVAAVLAHEVGHWVGGDALARAWSLGVTLPLYLLSELGYQLLKREKLRTLHFALRVLLWPIRITAEYLVIPLQVGTFREAEFRADAVAARAGYADPLRVVLAGIAGTFDEPRTGWEEVVYAGHPPIELRLERLERPGHRYPVREHHPLSRALPGWTPGVTLEKGW
ncbi:M48 family metalloprotease [Plantactinospora siamensis]|uniref:M48 family metalloprotease n=1 Tax=Plantactinospora siamensis TaxID=555372 RepID=A0ABV6P3Z1_9ACTN